ncbi:MAG: Hpt domain-containing protein [Hyphomicrobium sp.]|nr:Hpt domain-containing protein [Hyphomicrobium sp.]
MPPAEPSYAAHPDMHRDSLPETGAPVDLAHLSRYTLGDRGLELEILGLFVDQLPITIAALRESETEKDWGMAAHTLKGSARAVGAWSLATIAEEAERMRGLPPVMARAAVVDRLEEAARVARDFIAALPRVS